MTDRPLTARQFTINALKQMRENDTFASEAFESATNLSAQDRRLAMQMTLGIIRRRATLDALIRQFVSRPLPAIDPDVLDILHLGAYQLALMNGIPPHAAVHETVALGHFIGKAQVVGFVNGVLRRVSEIITNDFTDRPFPDSIPIEMVDEQPKYRFMRMPIFTPHDELAYIADAFSWPTWIAEKWLKSHGFKECCRLGFWFNDTPSLWIRVNSMKLTREEYEKKLTTAGITFEKGWAADSLKLKDAGAVPNLPGYEEGEFTVQDHSSQLVGLAVSQGFGEAGIGETTKPLKILDVCSAPGGKTTHLAELMKNKGTIIACDVDEERLETVSTLSKRLGLTNIETKLLRSDGPLPQDEFDIVLVDAPCSNTGVLGRRPEVRWRIQPSEIEHLIGLQEHLLLSAIERVKPSGILVYSTCSIEHEENRELVDRILFQRRTLQLEKTATAVPGRPADGGFWARFRVL